MTSNVLVGEHHSFFIRDLADHCTHRDGVLEEHLRASFESIIILSIIKKKRTKRKSFLWLFQATVAVFKLPLGRE